MTTQTRERLMAMLRGCATIVCESQDTLAACPGRSSATPLPDNLYGNSFTALVRTVVPAESDGHTD